MATKRRKRPTPIALLWTRRDQLRFTAAVERLVSAVNDLTLIATELRREHDARPRRRPRQPVAIGDQVGEGVTS